MNVSSSFPRQKPRQQRQHLKVFVATTQGLRTSPDRVSQQRFYAIEPQTEVTVPHSILSEEWSRRQAWAKAQQGDYSAAIEILTRLIENNPTSAKNYNNRGLVYFHSGQSLKALADYTKALQLDPQLTEAYNNRANYYVSNGLWQDALADYDRAIDLNPFSIRAWINRGITFRNLGQYDQSLDDLDFALRLGRLEGHVYAERGRTYHRMGDWNCAIADYQRAIALFSRLELALPDRRQRLRVEMWLNELFSPLMA